MLIARLFEEADAEHRVVLRVERAGGVQDAVLRLEPVLLPWRSAVISLAFAAIGGLAFRRARCAPAARAFLLASLSYGMSWHAFPGDGAIRQNAISFATLMDRAGPRGRVPGVLLFPERWPAAPRRAGRPGSSC